MRPLRLLAVTAAVVLASASPATAADAYTTLRATVPMVFPVIGQTSYSDTFLACRSGCARKHMGQDLMGPKMRPVVATFNGVIGHVKRESYVGEGNYVTLKGDNGWSANYIHMNNDTPGTDDGRGTASYAFAPGLRPGLRVIQGQLLGWAGDSGNAENTGPHIHFELRKGDPWSGTVYNAIWSLNAARRLSAPVVSGPHPDGSLVRSCATCQVFEVRDGRKRVVRPEVAVDRNWDLRTAVTVSAYEIAYYPYGTPVPLTNGRAYKAPDGAVWFVDNRRRLAVPDVASLAPLGIAPDRIRPMTAAGLATVPMALAGATLPATTYYEGALLKSAVTGEQWVMERGVRRLVPDAYTLGSRGLDARDAIAVTAEQMQAEGFPALGAPLLIQDGPVVKNGAGRLFVVSNGTLRWIPSWAIHKNYGYGSAIVTTPGYLNLGRLPAGAPMP